MEIIINNSDHDKKASVLLKSFVNQINQKENSFKILSLDYEDNKKEKSALLISVIVAIPIGVGTGVTSSFLYDALKRHFGLHSSEDRKYNFKKETIIEQKTYKKKEIVTISINERKRR